MIFPNDDTSFVADHPCLACLNLSYNTSKRKRQETKKKQKNVKMRSESVIDKRRRSQEEAREKARLEENQHEMKKQWKRRQRNIIRSQEKKKAEIKMRLQNALLVEGLEQNPLILNHLHGVMRIIIIIFNLVVKTSRQASRAFPKLHLVAPEDHILLLLKDLSSGVSFGR